MTRSTTEVGLVALGRVVSTQDISALDILIRKVTPDHFVDDAQQKLYALVERYSLLTGAVLGPAELKDLASRASDVGMVSRLVETYAASYRLQPTHDQFVFALDELRDRRAQATTRDAVSVAAEILRGTGVTLDRETWVGHADARRYLLEQLSAIEQEQSRVDSPRGDVLLEPEKVIEEYAATRLLRSQDRAPGVLTGLPTLDTVFGSFDPGELSLIVGWTSDGKTSFCVNLAWHAAVMQQKNVYFATTETLRPTVRRRIYSRHSAQPEFRSEATEGINSTDIKRGTLTEDDESKLRMVAADIGEGGRSGRYGKLEVAQIPKDCTITQLEGQLTRYAASTPIDLLIVDYFGLLAPERRRREARDELGETIKAGKVLAATFGEGDGIPVISPWQVSRSAREAAEKTGRYGLSSLSDTSEAEKSSDGILGLFRATPEGGNYPRHSDAMVQVLKNRDGARADDITVRVDYATCEFSDGPAAMLTPQADIGGLDSLLSG